MTRRTWWLAVSWIVFFTLGVLVLLITSGISFGSFDKWIRVSIFVIPSALVLYGAFLTMNTFTNTHPEKKTWIYFSIAASALVVGEILRGLVYLAPDYYTGFLSKLPYVFIFICFIFLIWGFWHQQSIIETTIGKNLRTLLTVILITFTIVLAFIAFFGLFKFEMDILSRVFLISFLIGDIFMFSGAMAVIARMWGGTLIAPWIVWGIGTLVLVAYHLISTRLILVGNVLLDTWTGVILALGLTILITAAEMRRSALM